MSPDRLGRNRIKKMNKTTSKKREVIVCEKCLQAIKDLLVAADYSQYSPRDLYFCMNEKCTRHGLATATYTTRKVGVSK